MRRLSKLVTKWVVFFIPELRGFAIKRFLYRLQGYKIGKNTKIASSARFSGDGKIEIGDEVWIGGQVDLISSKPAVLKIDSYVSIGAQCYITTGTHFINIKGVSPLGKNRSLDITIKEGAWINARCVILAGIVINERALVTAGSVVSNNISQDTVVSGVPAKFVKKIRE